MSKYIWFFGVGKTEGGKELSHILGNKGAQLCEMAKTGIPVPPGFIISTEACREYMKHGQSFLKKIEKDIENSLKRLAENLKKIRGNDFPLLVSVRSGAPVSMPGMMDTILNVGMNKQTFEFLKKIDERFAYDTMRRFIQMFSTIALRLEKEVFEKEFEKWKKSYELFREGKFSSVEQAYYNLQNLDGKAKIQDREIPADVLRLVVEKYQEIIREKGVIIPENILDQVIIASEAVFRSWNGERAVTYRKIHGLPDDIGTAVNIVAMVFGNMGDNSGTGVLFTRNPNTGERTIWGNFLPNAQGEDVVAGIRTPHAINENSKSQANSHLPTLQEMMPKAYKEIEKIARDLEHHYKEMQDIEFTIENGKVWILQTRNGKRTARANIKIIHDFIKEKIISESEGIMRVNPKSMFELLFPVVDEDKLKKHPIAKGLAASPGAVSGKIVLFSKEAEKLSKQGQDVILVRHETSPEDIAGIASAKGILTARGGETSHAAVVARAMGKPAVVGAEEIIVDYESRCIKIGENIIREGEIITIDGNTGRVFLGDVPIKTSDLSQEAINILKMADKIRTLKIRANADTPKDAKVARDFGAEGIGLLRTEHMFFDEERIPVMRKMIIYAQKYKEAYEELLKIFEEITQNGFPEGVKILSALKHMRIIPSFQRGKTYSNVFSEIGNLSINEVDKAFRKFRETREVYFDSLSKIKEWIKGDFKEIFSAMEGYPVTVRLIDPPLHEFLPKNEDEIISTAEKTDTPVEEVRNYVEKLKEQNPMLGHRGIRVGISYPEIYCMQIEAIAEAAVELIKRGKKVIPEVMFPNVIDPEEIKYFRNVFDIIVKDIEKSESIKLPISIGTMIEFPRACILADQIAKYVDFFSFGTNDLTQTVLGISRDDSGKFMPDYLKLILPYNPFTNLDVSGVGEFIKIAVERGKKQKPNLKIGVCGEHGGDPDSISFFNSLKFNYVSASPYRVLSARISAAQSVIKQGKIKSLTKKEKTAKKTKKHKKSKGSKKSK